jgi:hypothetical protein
MNQEVIQGCCSSITNDASVPLWSDATALAPHYKAICLIRMYLEDALERAKDARAKEGATHFYAENGFVSWPSANPVYARTHELMYLMNIYGVANFLITPFGKVGLTGSGGRSDLVRTSELFMESLREHCVLEDVTSKMRMFFLSDGEQGKFLLHLKDSIDMSNCNVYLIRRVNDITLLSEDITAQRCLYGEVHSTILYWKSKEMFKTISDGACCFVKAKVNYMNEAPRSITKI